MNPLDELRLATVSLARAKSEWREAIRLAMDTSCLHEDGYTVAAVVEAAGVSRRRLYPIAGGG